ncbi:fasciculation and elongation protein zeta-2 isoform X3 [Sapajus apella]|uniref:Fasciculation and elongation protein zeta-2 isoform X3 n=1 Tax=Sapajus apella TaxID=9515 RepID=A0A6J3ER22_SAPAP|nr:fasciculation and elongation protein zeta-2 isoform X3 [Sapajus apella]
MDIGTKCGRLKSVCLGRVRKDFIEKCANEMTDAWECACRWKKSNILGGVCCPYISTNVRYSIEGTGICGTHPRALVECESPQRRKPRALLMDGNDRMVWWGDQGIHRIWNALTDNYGNVMPVDWKSSHTRTLHLLTLNLSEKGVSDSLLFDASDDEELREQLDMHSIIVSCVNDEPLFTADQVIEEIEEMMQESPDPEDDETPTQSDRLSMLSQEIQTLKRSSTSSYEERVKRLSVSELNELLEEIETAIKEYSEELVQQLALRDELEFEKEVKNSFISVLIEVQNKQKEHKETAKKKKKLKNGSSQNGKNERSHMPGTYLTTVIPYEKKNGPPSVEDLQILTKILRAMKDDSEKVPSLLTDYILKVLCPT